MDREEAIKILKDTLYDEKTPTDYLEAVKMGREALENQKIGHWIEERNEYGEITHWHCSNCYEDSGFITTCKWDYCPQCGAKMESEEE